MIEQAIILVTLLLALGATLFLYLLRAKKQIEYRGDERWQAVQHRAYGAARWADQLLILVLVVAVTVLLFVPVEMSFTLGRVVLMG